MPTPRAGATGHEEARQEEEAEAARRLPVAGLRLLERPPALPAGGVEGAAAVQEDLGQAVRGAARVPADHRRQPDVHGRQRGQGGLPQPHDRQEGVVARRRLPGRRVARLRPQAHLRDGARALQGRPRRPRRRAGREARQGQVGEGPAQPQRVLPAVHRQHRLFRGRGRNPVRDARRHRCDGMDVPGGRIDQGRPCAGGRQALLRDLRRERLRRQPEDRQAGLADRHERRQLRALGRQLLRHAVGRLRPGLHRQHRRQHVLVLGRDRQAGVAARDRLVRLLVGGRRPAPRRRADRVLRQLRRDLLRARRPDRQDALDLRGRRQDLGRREPDRRHRLLLELGRARHRPACGPSPATSPGPTPPARSTRWCPTARRST